MSLITFEITGIAICEKVNDDFKVTFIREKNHKLRIISDDPYDADLKSEFYVLEGEKEKIEIVLSDAEPEGTEKDIDKLINLYKLHDKKVKPRSQIKVNLTELTLPKAIRFVKDTTNEIYEIWKEKVEIKGSDEILSQELKAKRPIAISFYCRYRIKSGGSVTIKVTNANNPISHSFNYPYQQGLNYNVSFDNTCPKECGNDFSDYYRALVEPTSGGFRKPELQVRINKITKDQPVSHELACNVVIIEDY